MNIIELTPDLVPAVLERFKFTHRTRHGNGGMILADYEPCDSCGVMSEACNAIYLVRPTQEAVTMLEGLLPYVDRNECLGYDDDDAEICEACNL